MNKALLRDAAAIKMRCVALAAKAEPVISVAGMLNEALALNHALLDLAQRALTDDETAQTTQPAGGTVPAETSAPAGTDRRPPGGSRSPGQPEIIGAGLERRTGGM